MMTPLFRLLTLAILGLLLVGTTACDKADPAPENATGLLLVGRWEFTHTTGGLAGRTRPADPARKQEIVFTDAGKAIFLLNGNTTNSWPYTLTQGPAINGRTETFVTYTNNSTIFSFINKLSATELVLTENIYDGFGLHYARR